ncbi:MAG: hypothetical protein QOE45_2161 [Frankiaceae bacterium]|jgi:hypothetical protein|nr:hypothetical protein [Frankiaceae bacterium]
MPDLPGLPPRGHRALDAPAGSADRVVRDGGLRRRRTALAAATAAGGVGALVAVVTVAGGASFSLGQRENGLAAGGGRARVSATGTVTAPSASGTGGPTASVTPSAGGSIGPGGPPPAGPSRMPDPTPVPGSASAPAVPAPEPMRRTRTTYAVGDVCNDQASGRTAKGWCLRYVGALSGRSGRPATLAVELCRLPGFPTGTASFPTTQEAELTISRGSPRVEVWRWSRGTSPARTRHGLAVGSGTCLRWTVVWSVSDDAGRPLAAGQYTLDAQVLADNLGSGSDPVRQTYNFSVT